MEKILDIHIYFGKSLFGTALEQRQLAQLKSEYPGLTGCLIPAKPYEYHYGPANKTIEEMGEWTHILRVDPWRDEAPAMVRETKARGLFLHPFEEQIYPTDHRVRRLVSEAEKREMPVMIACGYPPFSHAAQVLPLIRDFPRLPFILTHGGQINICGMHMDEAWEIFETCPNTFFETSGIYREDYIERAVERLGPERVLFGSATPRFDFHFEIERIRYLHCEDAVKQRILYQNAKKLLAP